MPHVYILKCADDSYYTGCTSTGLDARIGQHDLGLYDGYTKLRRPVHLLWSEEFADMITAAARERQIKGWSRRKKDALISGSFKQLQNLSKRSR